MSDTLPNFPDPEDFPDVPDEDGGIVPEDYDEDEVDEPSGYDTEEPGDEVQDDVGTR